MVAVVARLDEDIKWSELLPMPTVLYELGNRTDAKGYRLPARGPPAAAFAAFVSDHWTCLPPWTLFLSATGRVSATGRGIGRGGERGSGLYHALAPAITTALLDIDSIDNGFLSIGHHSGRPKSHPVSATGRSSAARVSPSFGFA